MAHNVKWILDHSANAKIVLWAHNQHVSLKGHVGGYKSMGVELHDLYGDQMVVFGFAFNQGSFQAVEQNGPLRNFTVPPMPPDSLDATLAASGIPLFALDLQHAPAWFDAPHKSRTIGAVFFRDHPADHEMDLAPRAHYTAILFVERTQAAIPLTRVSQIQSKPPAVQRVFEPPPHWIRP
jgi:erythromycin esterase